MLRRGRYCCSGFSLVETLVAIAILALLAAVVIPTVKSQLDRSEVSAIAENLHSLREAILAYRENVGFYPSELVQLATIPGALGVTTNSSCGTATPAANIARWRGPYIAQAITTSGIPSGEVTILNALVRSPSTATWPNPPDGTLRVEVSDAYNAPGQTFVAEVERAFDGASNDLSTGAIRWTPTVPLGPVGKLEFHIAIRGC